MNSLCLEAPAKINWRLKIVGRRVDGYHLLCGLMQSISLTDTVYLHVNGQDNCRISTGCISQEDNLARAAWLLLKRELGLSYSLDIEIEKRIPIGGGLAGGSADAAAVLKGANELFDLGLSLNELITIGQKLGADIPFCLLGGLAKAEGAGEILTPLPLPAQPLSLLLVNPGQSVPTGEVFTHYAQNGYGFAMQELEDEACQKLFLALQGGDIPIIQTLLDNDLSASARELCPAIIHIERRLRKLGLYPLVSGSGCTVFALLESDAILEEAKSDLIDLPWIASVRTVGN